MTIHNCYSSASATSLKKTITLPNYLWLRKSIFTSFSDQKQFISTYRRLTYLSWTALQAWTVTTLNEYEVGRMSHCASSAFMMKPSLSILRASAGNLPYAHPSSYRTCPWNRYREHKEQEWLVVKVLVVSLLSHFWIPLFWKVPLAIGETGEVWVNLAFLNPPHRIWCWALDIAVQKANTT